MNNTYVIHALLAAALFGASTPFAKLLVGEMSPWLLAGLLYLGSGVGLAAVRLVRDRGWKPSGLATGELVLFVLALRGLGTARTGAYFSTAPFIGAAVSIVLLGEVTSTAFWIAAALMALGVCLHLTEHHEHEHVHASMEHSHRHVHDAHHQHAHPFAWIGDEPHEHWHRHEAMVHRHPHFPDIHHRHLH